ncbi:hypothetical protein AVEN_29404-1, partial [Araneus ventricosus]
MVTWGMLSSLYLIAVPLKSHLANTWRHICPSNIMFDQTIKPPMLQRSLFRMFAWSWLVLAPLRQWLTGQGLFRNKNGAPLIPACKSEGLDLKQASFKFVFLWSYDAQERSEKVSHFCESLLQWRNIKN